MTVREIRGRLVFLTGSTDIRLVRKIVYLLETERENGGPKYAYQINSSTLDEVFLDLNAEIQTPAVVSAESDPDSSAATLAVVPVKDIVPVSTPMAEKDGSEKDIESTHTTPDRQQDDGLVLTPGKKSSRFAIFADAYTIFLKRFIVLRRSFLLPIIAVVVVICAATIPLFFIKERKQTCAFVSDERIPQSLTYPYSIYPAKFSPIVLAPGSLVSAFGSFPNAASYVRSVPDNTSFVNVFDTDYTNVTFGGVSLASGSAQSLFAFEGSSLENKGLSALNLLSNAMLDEISPSTTAPLRIRLVFQFLASPSFLSTAQAFKWLAFV